MTNESIKVGRIVRATQFPSASFRATALAFAPSFLLWLFLLVLL